jgi:hypothetical protein
MGLSKEQALTVSEVWFRIDNPKHKSYGDVRRARRNGATKTWKRDPERFRLPVKYGLYEHIVITEDNASSFYASEDEARASANPKTKYAIVAGEAAGIG